MLVLCEVLSRPCAREREERTGQSRTPPQPESAASEKAEAKNNYHTSHLRPSAVISYHQLTFGPDSVVSKDRTGRNG
jgi:hypothetical protein